MQNDEIKNDWQLRQNWAGTNKMPDKNKTKIDTRYLNFNTKTSRQSKIQSSAKITKLVIAKCAR